MKKLKEVLGKWKAGFLVLALVMVCAGHYMAQAKADVKLSDEQVKAGAGFDEQIKQSQQVLNAVLSQAVQSNFDTQSALEVLGRIQTAYLRSEYLKLQKAGWEKDMQIAHSCGGCTVDLPAKVMRPPRQEAVKRE